MRTYLSLLARYSMRRCRRRTAAGVAPVTEAHIIDGCQTTSLPTSMHAVQSKLTGSGAKRRILILLAHPSPERSEVSIPMAAAAAKTDAVTLVDLYADYPTFDIDVEREQSRLSSHDVVIFLHPLYWYSTPSLLKEWLDLVFEYGYAYGSEGKALVGKVFFCALSAGGPEAAYRSEGYHHFTIRELLQPLEQTAALCGMIYLPPFALFGSRTALGDGRLDRHIRDWGRLLEALRDARVDIDTARRLPKLNDDLDAILLGD